MFKTTFSLTADELSGPKIDLVLDGLDTYATVTLVKLHAIPLYYLELTLYTFRMDIILLSSWFQLHMVWVCVNLGNFRTESQFIKYKASAKEHLKVGSNELVLDFESTFLKVESSRTCFL